MFDREKTEQRWRMKNEIAAAAVTRLSNVKV